ncbi:unnamed protein product [Paramecium sonneborni]|uniref:Protein kinase domain-containing protein n=1 Tax=Paramecium sonneborni TaxID=65129 RepID=A0A8S1R976_9CILI|nr:unnamed protein product [Paramecium sonneborni]
MICIKKNLFFDDSFKVQLLSDSIKLSNDKKMIKYIIPLFQNSCIEWKLSKCQSKLEGFSILLNGKLEYFEMEQNHLELLKQFLDGKIFYMSIHKIYKTVLFCGRGTYGHVFKYQNCLTGEYVACKSLKIGFKNTQEIFLEEVKILQTLKHPNIVKIKEFYMETKHFYIIMEYLDGKSLGDLLNQKILDDQEIIVILKQILRCIIYIHKAGYVYRDIKQENILFGEFGNLQTLRLIDFGLAIHQSDLQKQRKLICGTAGYIAPEVFKLESQIDQKIDIFGVGVLLWEMINNSRFIEGQDQEEKYRLNREYVFQNEFTQNIRNPIFRYLVEKMIVDNPEQRISAADALSYLDWAGIQSCDFMKDYENISTE